MTSLTEVLHLNAAFVDQFTRERAQRQLYRSIHPTEVAVAGCMDGRTNFRALTQVRGSLTDYRNIGGVFDLGWPAFDPVFAEWIKYAVSKRRRNLLLVCYHFSASDRHLGCRGHGFDADRARGAAERFARQVEEVYGHGQVFPILVGIETDEDNLLIHSSVSQDVLSVGHELVPETNGNHREAEQKLSAHFAERLHAFFPAMWDDVVRDFVPYLVGNYRHVLEVRASQRLPEHLDHSEWLIGLGQGIHPWLTKSNTALIVNEFDPDLDGAIKEACGIVEANIFAGRTHHNPVLLVCAPYREKGPNLQRAKERVKQLVQFTHTKVSDRITVAFREQLTIMTAVMDIHTRRIIEILEGTSVQSEHVRSTLPPIDNATA